MQHAGRIYYFVQRAGFLEWSLRQHDPDASRGGPLPDDRPAHAEREPVRPRSARACKGAFLHWDTYARACDMAWPLGVTARSICLPDEPVPVDFKLCIFRDGEHACPTTKDGVFTEAHVFYDGVEDERQCSPCACASPTGSACTATVSIYKGNDLTCSGPTVAKGITISSEGPTCLDIQLPGQALGSKLASPIDYLPGTCSPTGGDASGSAIKTEPVTFCCRPDGF